MREFQEKKLWKRRLYSKSTLLILIVLLAFLAHGTWSIFLKERESQANLNRVKAQLADLNTRSGKLSTDISSLNTTEGVENEIRSKYDVAKTGEGVLVIVDKTNSTSSSLQGNGQSWWQKFLNLFKRN